MSCPSDEEGEGMLSQSLRDIVYNNEPVSDKKDIEKIYDLDTSRFEEEYSNLPSSKKKILLNGIEEEKTSIF
jgi:hypothetical protein